MFRKGPSKIQFDTVKIQYKCPGCDYTNQLDNIGLEPLAKINRNFRCKGCFGYFLLKKGVRVRATYRYYGTATEADVPSNFLTSRRLYDTSVVINFLLENEFDIQYKHGNSYIIERIKKHGEDEWWYYDYDYDQ